MPQPTYTPLATVTLGSSASSVTFSSIPTDGTYRDLVLVFDGATTGTALIFFRFNSDSGSNYPAVIMRGTGANTTNSASYTDTRIFLDNSDAVSTDRLMATANIMDYSATDKHKTVLVRSGYSSTEGRVVEAEAARWANTAAVTSIAVSTSSNAMAAGTTLSLYGIAS